MKIDSFCRGNRGVIGLAFASQLCAHVSTREQSFAFLAVPTCNRDRFITADISIEADRVKEKKREGQGKSRQEQETIAKRESKRKKGD